MTVNLNLYFLIMLISFQVNLFVWSVVYGQRSGDRVAKMFLVLCSSLALWGLSECIVFFVDIPYEYRIWLMRFSGVFWIPLGILSLRFVYALLDLEPSRFFYVWSFFFPIIMVFYWFTDLGVHSLRTYYWGVGPYMENIFLHTGCAIYTSVPSAGALWLIIKAARETDSQMSRNTYVMILLGGSLALSGALAVDMILPNFFGMMDIFRGGSSAMMFFCIFIYLAVRRNRFLSISVEHVAEELFEDVPDGIVLANPAGRIRRMNQAARDFGGLNGNPTGEFYLSDLCKECDFSSDFTDYEVERQQNGEERFYSASSAAIRRKGRHLGRILFLRDVTNRKLMERTLKRSHAELEQEVARRTEQLEHAKAVEALGTLAGVIAHDFNNLLAVIVGYASAAKEDLPAGDPIGEDLTEILQAGKRARDIIKKILTFRHNEPERKVININDVIHETLGLIQVSVPSSIEIHHNIDRRQCYLLGDNSQLSQVMMNLCTNALYAMKKGGGELKVTLDLIEIDEEFAAVHKALEPGEHVRLLFSDTGPGIPPDVLGKIFDPFFTTKPKGEGTGLGLSSVWNIVQAHGGAVEVHSELGVGTTFTIYLPAVEAKKRDSLVTQDFLEGGTERILLVDDENQLVRMGRRMLEPLGYRVTAMASSLDALRVFEANPTAYDLVVTDQIMPEMTGIDLAQKLLAIRPDLPIVMVSGYTDSVDSQRIKQVGIRAFLAKPVSRSRLHKAIRKLMDEDQETLGVYIN